MTTPALPSFTGLSHVALTVSDLKRSVDWYVGTLGFAPLMPFDTDEFDRRILFHPSGAIVALTGHHRPGDGPYDPRRIGLDHLAFTVRSIEELQGWADRLTDLGIAHAGIQVTAQTGSALVAFTDPDGIALEFYVQTTLPAR